MWVFWVCWVQQESLILQRLQPCAYHQAKAHLEGDPALEHLRALVVDGSLVDHSEGGASSDRGDDSGHVIYHFLNFRSFSESIYVYIYVYLLYIYNYIYIVQNEVFNEVSSQHKKIKED